MKERSELIAAIRGEIVGPAQWLAEPAIAVFRDAKFLDAEGKRRGPLAWQPQPDSEKQEILYFDRESPHRKYGAGLLYPSLAPEAMLIPSDEAAADVTDVLGTERYEDDAEEEAPKDASADEDSDDADVVDDFEVTGPDLRRPSTLGVSFCVRLDEDGAVVVNLPQGRRFTWQQKEDAPVQVNGRYESCGRLFSDEHGTSRESPMWRRVPALSPDTVVEIKYRDLRPGKVLVRAVPMPEGSPIALEIKVFPRKVKDQLDQWLLTVILCNASPLRAVERESVLFQTFFEISVQSGELARYPESQRSFEKLDPEEQSLMMLYRESATWGIGHGCAAGWDADPGDVPRTLYADVMPAVEVPSMTPEIVDSHERPIQLSMRGLTTLSDDGSGEAWGALCDLFTEYEKWIERKRAEMEELPATFRSPARRHMDACTVCLKRISAGIDLLKTDKRARQAFRLANLAMLLQQIATKQLDHRPLSWIASASVVRPDGQSNSPWSIYASESESEGLGVWRAFQIAFLLMSLTGVAVEDAEDRDIVDLIWFPTGGGKTEAYLGVMAFYMFHERLLPDESGLRRDGTNVIMRYTLRMLTTQQFQRAASLICAMEFLRRNAPGTGIVPSIRGGRFSVGLWIGGDGSPNSIAAAKTAVNAFKKDDSSGNPLVLTECPWCRAEIGRCGGARPSKVQPKDWVNLRIRGITNHPDEGPLLHCSDGSCAFGSETWAEWLPVEVIDERIYHCRPSLVIATADKLAMIAYRPKAGALFGRVVTGLEFPKQAFVPPGLIVQDELHLISGPLGTMYGLYEVAIEQLCSRKHQGHWLKPKLIASTATIRGADDQVRALYGRQATQLFPSPGLLMGDSFFGTYARNKGDRSLRHGRLYLGLHTSNYGSVLTTQVRAFSSSLFRPYSLPADRRDAWWSLLVFYNSIRELGGAKTLFEGDIRSRLKFLFNRENFPPKERRNLRIIEELTSRLSQAEIIKMMSALSTPYAEQDNRAPDACLASNIIEVGVDIDRLSIMGIVGQPKTTAQYIQVTGRVGRRWWERPGLILMLYNPGKSRDRSHFEQFHGYHRRLYERVEPTSATPFALSAIQRAMPGVLLAWARQQSSANVDNKAAYEAAIESGFELLRGRCEQVLTDDEDKRRSIAELKRMRGELERKWDFSPLEWEEFPPSVDGEYLMLWPGQFSTRQQKDRGLVIPSSMRQVDGSGELTITQGYVSDN